MGKKASNISVVNLVIKRFHHVKKKKNKQQMHIKQWKSNLKNSRCNRWYPRQKIDIDKIRSIWKTLKVQKDLEFDENLLRISEERYRPQGLKNRPVQQTWLPKFYLLSAQNSLLL